MVARDILLAELTGVRYHVAHLSTQHAVAMVTYAKARGLRGHVRSMSASLLDHRRGREGLRRELQDEAAATLRAATWMPRSKGSRTARWTRSQQTMRRTRAARRCRSSRSVPFGILGLETAIGLTFESWCIRANLADEDGRTVHDRTRPRSAPQSRHAGDRRAGRYHRSRSRARDGHMM